MCQFVSAQDMFGIPRGGCSFCQCFFFLGYGFVNFTTPEEAYQAIQATNNMQFGPCVLTVRLANSSKGSGNLDTFCL